MTSFVQLCLRIKQKGREMSEIEFRRAGAADTEAVTDCIAAAYSDAMRDIPDLPDVTDGVGDDITAHQAWVATMDEGIVGFIVFDQVDSAMMIFNLAVSPKAQGAGLARRLIEIAEQEARDSGVTMLRLRTHKSMQRTVSIYLHLGWGEEEMSGNTILMEKELS